MRLVSAVAVLATVIPSLTSASRLTPPVLPLTVRNPYLHTWLARAREHPWENWPIFWTGEHIGFSVLASVPDQDTAYPLLGRPQDSLRYDDDSYNIAYPIYKGQSYDASTTNLSYSIPFASSNDSLDITLSFLSPITPDSTFRQSIPASYFTVLVSGTVDVNIYTDLNGQWVSGDRGNKIVWGLDHLNLDGHAGSLKSWHVKRENEHELFEIRDRGEWGTLHFTGPSDVRHESGTSAHLRQRFARTGTLQNENDNNFRAIMDNEPVFAFSKSFRANATKKHESQAVTFTIAHTQDVVAKFAAARGLTYMRPLWASYINTVDELLTFHYLDFDHATYLANKYSDKVAEDAYKSGAEDYVDIVAISARQVMGATSFAGTPDDPVLFLKEISSNGDFQTIDVIFPAFPFFLYTQPRWLAYLLEPLIEHMLSGQYPNTYAMHDLGVFPNAPGHPDGNDEYMPVEECGNMLIMGLAVVNAMRDDTHLAPANFNVTNVITGFKASKEGGIPLNVGEADGIRFLDTPWRGGELGHKQAKKWVTRSYRLWKQWTGYLVEFSLRPANQLSTDDFAGWLELQTNLALKGIIGIKAMAGLADLVDNKADFDKYTNISTVYVDKWEEYGMSRDGTHAKLSYNWYGSWTTLYNLYADSLLCFQTEGSHSIQRLRIENGGQKPLKPPKGDHDGFVPKHIYQKQSDWYYNARQNYGLPLDNRHRYAKTDWEFFAMAVVAPRVRATILQSLAKWVNETNTDLPLTDLHWTNGDGGFGAGIQFKARPVVGGHFAFLTLERACGGRAMDGLKFLDDSIVDDEQGFDIQVLLDREIAEHFAEQEL